MSVLIKGMEMPTRCFACPLCIGEENDWSCAISHGPYIEYRVIETDIAIDTCPDWCPLVSIPPHGRLIDADKMRESIMKQTALTRLIGGEELAEIAETLEKGFLQEINNAPTIIPEDDKT